MESDFVQSRTGLIIGLLVAAVCLTVLYLTARAQPTPPANGPTPVIATPTAAAPR